MRWGNNNVPLCNVRYNIIYEIPKDHLSGFFVSR